jgi:anti-sigma factor RsiW
MNCSSVDLKAHFLGETARAEKNSVEDHLRACQNCREELDRLKLTDATLRTLVDEEPPQRIAFVSDKVFEPRWYQTIWRSGPAMGFASAVLLAAAIFAHGVVRPAAPVTTAAVNTAQIEQRIEREVNTRLDAVVAKQHRETVEMLDAAEKRSEAKRQADLAVVQQVAQYYQKKTAQLMVAVNQERPPQ